MLYFLMLRFFYIRTQSYCPCWVLYFVGYCSLSVCYIKLDDEHEQREVEQSTKRYIEKCFV